MSTNQRIPLDTTPAGIQRLYYRILLGSVATTLVVQLLVQLFLGAGPDISVKLMALYAAILLVSWLGYEIVRDKDDPGREPTGFVLGIMSLLLVVLCVETGGLSSPYYMLLFTTCVFGALLMRPGRAFSLTTIACMGYGATAWVYPADGRILEEGFGGVLAMLRTGPDFHVEEVSTIVIHTGFLYLGTWIAVRLSVGFRAQVVKLETSATRDPLTKLPNRRGFMEKLRLEAKRLIQWDWPLAILVIDLDHFKLVNDRFGHNVGDEVLEVAARLLRESAGPLDHVARLGGEEFAIAAIGADRRHGADVADRLIRAFRDEQWEECHAGLKTLTCSVGVATCHPSRDERSLEDFAALIEEADHALLRVKGSGRNGYFVAGDTPPPPTPRSPTVAPRGDSSGRPPGKLRMIRR